MWVIKLTHKKTGNFYYLAKIRTENGVSKPVGCMIYRAPSAALRFSSLGSALAVIKSCSPCDWKFRVRPASRLGHPLSR